MKVIIGLLIFICITVITIYFAIVKKIDLKLTSTLLFFSILSGFTVVNYDIITKFKWNEIEIITNRAKNEIIDVKNSSLQDIKNESELAVRELVQLRSKQDESKTSGTRIIGVYKKIERYDNTKPQHIDREYTVVPPTLPVNNDLVAKVKYESNQRIWEINLENSKLKVQIKKGQQLLGSASNIRYIEGQIQSENAIKTTVSEYVYYQVEGEIVFGGKSYGEIVVLDVGMNDSILAKRHAFIAAMSDLKDDFNLFIDTEESINGNIIVDKLTNIGPTNGKIFLYLCGETDLVNLEKEDIIKVKLDSIVAWESTLSYKVKQSFFEFSGPGTLILQTSYCSLYN